MSNNVRIKDCIDNHEKYVLMLAAMPDKKLIEKLDTIHLQMDIAAQKRNTASLELLEIWRAQTIEARTYKAENNVPDAPNEIELAIANIETFVAEPEKEKEVLNEYATTGKRRAKPHNLPANDKQLSIF
jgi:hypothetical protein